MQRLSQQENNLLRSPTHRVRLYAAIFNTFQLHVKTQQRDATSDRIISRTQWKPVLNIGPHRLAFVGEDFHIDAKDSYQLAFDDLKGRKFGYGEDSGYGKGTNLPNLDWRIYNKRERDTSPYRKWSSKDIYKRSLNQNWKTTQTFQFDRPGLYRLTCSVANDSDEVAQRWVRVYQSREEVDWVVTAIDGLAGTWGEGWSCGLTLHKKGNIDPGNTGFERYQCVGIYAEDEWWDEQKQQWVRQAIGSVRQDQRLVILGYVSEGSVNVDPVSKTINVTLETIHGQMSRCNAHKLAVWQGRGPKALLRDRKNESGKRQQVDYVKNDVDNWGAILQGFLHVNVSDFALYLLQFKTNLLEEHDFYCMWNDDLAHAHSIAGEEGSVLSNLQTAADNEWMITGSDHSSAIIFGPDRQVQRDITGDQESWNFQWNKRMDIDRHDCWSLVTKEKLEKEIKYVKLIANNPRSGDQYTAEYPHEWKTKNQQRDYKNRPGTWLIKDGLIEDDKSGLRRKAERVYNMMNLRWEADITMGLNRAFRCGDIVSITYEANGVWEEYKRFLVKGISYETSPAEGTWTTKLSLEEATWDND